MTLDFNLGNNHRNVDWICHHLNRSTTLQEKLKVARNYYMEAQQSHIVQIEEDKVKMILDKNLKLQSLT